MANQIQQERCNLLLTNIQGLLVKSRLAAHHVRTRPTEENPISETVVFRGFNKPPYLLVLDFSSNEGGEKFKAALYKTTLDEKRNLIPAKPVLKGEYSKQSEFLSEFSDWFNKKFKRKKGLTL